MFYENASIVELKGLYFAGVEQLYLGMAILITILSGYLAVTHLAGRKLTTTHTIILSTFYSFIYLNLLDGVLRHYFWVNNMSAYIGSRVFSGAEPILWSVWLFGLIFVMAWVSSLMYLRYLRTSD